MQTHLPSTQKLSTANLNEITPLELGFVSVDWTQKPDRSRRQNWLKFGENL